MLLGNSQVVAASLLFVPLTLVIAVLLPGNEVLPFGDLATIGFFISMAVGVHKGNLFRTLISGIFIMAITIWIANMTIDIHTKLAKDVGSLGDKGQVISLDQGGSPITFILRELVSLENALPLLIIGLLYVLSVIFTYFKFKKGKIYPDHEMEGEH